MSVQILVGDNRVTLAGLAAGSVNTCVTSPPYWALRDYGTEPLDWPAIDYAPMPGLPPCVSVPAMRCSLGLEPTLEAFIGHMVLVFRGVHRVLREDGTLWLNMGDSYCSTDKWGGGKGGNTGKQTVADDGSVPSWAVRKKRQPQAGLKPKDLVGQPWRLAFALQADGWWLRQDVIWHKPNPMPESIKDRCTKAHEYIFLLAKSERYYYDAGAIKETSSEETHARYARGRSDTHKHANVSAVPGQKPNTIAQSFEHMRKRVGGWQSGPGSHTAIEHTNNALERGQLLDTGAYGDGKSERMGRGPGWRKLAEAGSGTKNNESFDCAMAVMPDERNKRSVWTVTTEGFPGAHFACVDAATEALTPAGWRKHTDLADGAWIAAFDRETESLVWQPATFHRYDFDGEMVAIEKRDASQLLTPNHRCLIQRRGGAKEVVRAENLKPGMSIPMVATLPANRTAQAGPGESMAALLGWYVTEGEKLRSGCIRINQSESANPEKCLRIRTLLDEVGAEWTERTRTREWRGRPSVEVVFAIRGRVALELHHYSPAKAIDWSWIDWPVAHVQAFLDAVIDGDGHRRQDGRCCVIQKDRAFLDAAQVLAMRLGLRAHVGPHGDQWALYLTEGRWLTLRGTNGSHTPLARRQYVGTVWCPSVPASFWLARREGKPFITGNTFPTKLIEPCILAGCPPGGTVLDCFGGSGTTGVVADRHQRNAILCELNPAYADLARDRVHGDAPLLAEVEAIAPAAPAAAQMELGGGHG